MMQDGPLTPAMLCRTALLLLVLFTGGCAAAGLATLGVAADITASAVTTGQVVFALGKLDTAEMADYGQIIAATRLGASDLGLVLKNEADDKKNATITLGYMDEKNSPIWITLDRRADRLVRVSVNVGLFGSEVTAQLLLSRIREHMPHPATAPSAPST